MREREPLYRRDSGVDYMSRPETNAAKVPEIIIDKASVSSSPESGCSKSSTSGAVASSDFVTVFLKVTMERESDESEVRVDISAKEKEKYDAVRGGLVSLKKGLGICGPVKSKCVGILSDRHQQREERRLSISRQRHLDEALKEFREEQYTTFEVHEIIEPATESPSTRKDLRDELASARIKTQNNQSFIPISTLRKVLSKPKVLKLFRDDDELAKLATPKLNELVTRIIENGLRILATILLADTNSLGALVVDFEENNMLDDDMPFDPEDCPCFLGTNEPIYHNICKSQWQTVSLEMKPYNSTKPDENRFGSELVIPFLEMQTIHKGGFGVVYRVKFHPDYQKILKPSDRENPSFALKKFRRATDKSLSDFNRELNALVHIANKEVPYLMQLVTAFQHGEDFYLLFPLAECSLKDCFKNEDHVGEKDYFHWILSQLQGLSEGIHAIHGDVVSGHLLVPPQESEMLGYHHDLKPDNILLQKDSKSVRIPFSLQEALFGRLQITDFGLGRFRKADTGSISVYIKGTPTYAAPESITEQGQARAYDIWSFGCIMMETLVWLLDGKDGLESFIDSRKRDTVANTGETIYTDSYWVKRSNGVILNEAVCGRIKRIRNQKVLPDLNSAINELVDLVEDCLKVDPRKRPKAKELSKRMKSICERVNS